MNHVFKENDTFRCSDIHCEEEFDQLVVLFEESSGKENDATWQEVRTHPEWLFGWYCEDSELLDHVEGVGTCDSCGDYPKNIISRDDLERILRITPEDLIESERKWIVPKEKVPKQYLEDSQKIQQGYLAEGTNCIVRVRLVDDEVGHLTVKSSVSDTDCVEVETLIDGVKARTLLALCDSNLIKTRYSNIIVHHAEQDSYDSELVIDVIRKDSFQDHYLVEIEKINSKIDINELLLPEFLSKYGKEVTGEKSYSNYSISKLDDLAWEV